MITNLIEEKSSKKIIYIIAAVIIFIVAVAPSYYFYNKYQKTQKMIQNPGLGLQEEARAIAEKVGKLIVLPAGEEPTVITVADVEKLKSQPFFANAKNGDKVLVFQKARKAILYDPVAGKIIEVGPLIEPSPTPANISPTTSVSQSPSPSPSPSPTTTQTFKAVLYNGTSTVGLTKKVEDILKAKAPYIEIADKDNAKKNDYAKTLIIDLNGKNGVEVQNLIKIVGGEVSTLPAGETKPENADFLIIVGADKK